MPLADYSITNNEKEQRYEVHVDGELALVQYKLRGKEITFIHTDVPEALGGRGIGSALARAVLDDARERGFTVVPLCPFISAYIARHSEYLALVKPSDRARIERASLKE